jgi:hypothetical protein
VARTPPLGKGKQLDITGIEILIGSDQDLMTMFSPVIDTAASPPVKPLFSITVIKEMFPGLFADPFRHRVHNVAGFDDLKRGRLENGKVMDVDGIPTLVSIGAGTCKWRSPRYSMPQPTSLSHASWDLAASRRTLQENFSYSLSLDAFDSVGNLIQTLHLTNPANMTQPGNLNPTQARKTENLKLTNVAAYEIEFTADVKKDAALYEKSTTLIGDSIGTPLLRAVNLLEPVDSVYDITSLQELLCRSSNYHLFERQDQFLKQMIATLELSATLVQSENEVIQNNDPSDPNSVYEFIEFAVVTDKFTALEARLRGDTLLRVAGQPG